MVLRDLFAGLVDSRDEQEPQAGFDGTADAYEQLPGHSEQVLRFLRELPGEGFDYRLAAGLKIDIIRSVTTQIIHYKDAMKVPNPAITVPFFLYGEKDSEQFGLIVVPERPAGYLYAKAYYYCLTERGGLFDRAMNRILAVYLDEQRSGWVLEKVSLALEGKDTFGAVQRSMDQVYIPTVEALQEAGIAESRRVFEKTREILRTPGDSPEPINEAIVRCYLLKKNAYVSIMKNRYILRSECGGDLRKLRDLARRQVCMIPFTSYSDLWRNRTAPAARQEEGSGTPQLQE